MTCAKCGNEVAEGVSVCPHCGALFGVPQAPKQPDPAGYSQQPTATPSPYGAYPSPYPQYPGNYGQLPPPNDTKAIISLVLGILSLVCCYLGILPGIAAIALGHLSRGSIRKSTGQLQGDGMALAGMVMGYLSLGWIVILALIAIPNFRNGMDRSRTAANEASAVGSVRTVNTAEITYQATYPTRGFAANLATLGGKCTGGSTPSAERACLVDDKLGAATCTGTQWCIKNGYKFMVEADSSEPHTAYTVTAVPISPGTTGKRGFCSTEEGLINFDSEVSLRTTPYTHDECKALPAL